jgi:hypothetical protein
MLHIDLLPGRLHEFTKECRRRIRALHFTEFGGFKIWFSAKGMKDSFRCLIYTDLRSSWNKRWEEEFDSEYKDGADRVLNWKPCCIRKYWETRSKKYGPLGLGRGFGWSGMCGVQGIFLPS